MRSTSCWSRKTQAGVSTLSCMVLVPAGLSRFPRFFNAADHVKRGLRIVLKFIAQNTLASVQRVFTAHQATRRAGKLFRGKKRLGQKTLQPPGAKHDLPVILR